MTKSKNKNLIFTCPECGEHRLECVLEGVHTCVVTSMPDSGNFEYGNIESEADVLYWQCIGCGFVLKNKQGDNITANEDVVKWIKKN